MKQIFQTINRLYNFKIVFLFIGLFLIIQIPFLQRIPDFFQLTKIEAPQLYLLRLLTIVIGFSSFILTTFLVIYNVFSKRLKRNSFDFILNNPWINLIFSIFFGSLMFILLAIFSIQLLSKNAITTLVYFSSFIAFGNLILQFPLIILSLQYSNSFNSIKNIIKNIKHSDIENLYNPNYGNNDAYHIEQLEKNNLIQLKDIGVSAIKEDDWGLPQTILNDLFIKLIEKSDIDIEDYKQLNRNLFAYNFVSRHFQKVALDSTDEITTKVTLNNLFRTHTFFIDRKIRHIRHNPIDSNFHDLLRTISDNSAYYNIQQYLLVNLVKLIQEHINSISYSDEELPTRDYIFEQKNFNYDTKDETISNYWFYIKKELPDLFFDILKYSIETGNKNIYDRFNWQLHSLFSSITESKNLTKSQENELFSDYSFKASRVSELAIENKIFKNIEIYSHIQIEIWIEKKKKYAFWAFYDFTNLLHKLNKVSGLDTMLIDDYFMIARSISSKQIDKVDKYKVFESIIENGFEIYNNKTTLPEIKQEIKKQLKWLNQFIEGEKDLAEIKSKFTTKILALK
jgi:hypothetical protein